MQGDPYRDAIDYLTNTDWLMKEADKVTERYIALEKQLRKCELNFEEPSDELIDKLEDIHSHMRELENRMMFEEKQYTKVMKKLDDTDF
tara:strand:- start:113 stop:379 length:267 start_codon:yes stop_codon:yes gene_type:complete